MLVMHSCAPEAYRVAVGVSGAAGLVFFVGVHQQEAAACWQQQLASGWRAWQDMYSSQPFLQASPQRPPLPMRMCALVTTLSAAASVTCSIY